MITSDKLLKCNLKITTILLILSAIWGLMHGFDNVLPGEGNLDAAVSFPDVYLKKVFSGVLKKRV